MLFEPATNTEVEESKVAPPKRRAKVGLLNTKLRALAPKAKAYKVTDGAGMYVVVSTSASKSFVSDLLTTSLAARTQM